MTNSVLLERAFRYFRSRRMRLFLQTFAISADTRILDVGGSPEIWQFIPVRPRLTFANLPSAVTRDEHCRWVGADGCRLPFRDKAFDIAFSNSVIEHVGDAQSQAAFAAEIRRVARAYWVQTPDRVAPFEMHSMLPFVHFLPKNWQSPVMRRISPWSLITHPNEEQKEYFFASVLRDLRLLGDHELRSLFPDATVVRERIGGIPKSLVAFHK